MRREESSSLNFFSCDCAPPRGQRGDWRYGTRRHLADSATSSPVLNSPSSSCACSGTVGAACPRTLFCACPAKFQLRFVLLPPTVECCTAEQASVRIICVVDSSTVSLKPGPGSISKRNVNFLHMITGGPGPLVRPKNGSLTPSREFRYWLNGRFHFS